MRQWTIDAFASEPFKGNPACVVEPMRGLAADAAMRMLALAAENNQAETAFLLATGDPARFVLRWFTPGAWRRCSAATPPLRLRPCCSSPSLGLRRRRRSPFDTQSGPLIVTRGPAGGYRMMDFLAIGLRTASRPCPGLAEALGARVPVEVWSGHVL